MAKYCLRRLEYISRKGPRGKPPTLAEIESASDAAFHPSIFGESLDAIFRLQERNYPEQAVPIILPFLADGILALGGLKAEGIFRVPGDGDLVGALVTVVVAPNTSILAAAPSPLSLGSSTSSLSPLSSIASPSSVTTCGGGSAAAAAAATFTCSSPAAFTAAKPSLAAHQQQPAPGKDKNRKKSKSKVQQQKTRTIKFHEYKVSWKARQYCNIVELDLNFNVCTFRGRQVRRRQVARVRVRVRRSTPPACLQIRKRLTNYCCSNSSYSCSGSWNCNKK